MKPQFSADLIARQRLLAEREMVQKKLTRRGARKAGITRTKEQQREADSYRQMQPEVQQKYAEQYMQNNPAMATRRISGYQPAQGVEGEEGYVPGQFKNFNPNRFGAEAWGGTKPSGKVVEGQSQLNTNAQAAAGNHPQGLQMGLDPSLKPPAGGEAQAPAPQAGAQAPAPQAEAPAPQAEAPAPQAEAQADNDGDGVADQAEAPAPAPQAGAQAPAPQAPAPQTAGLDPRVTQMAQMQAAGKDAQITQGARPEKAKWSDKTLGQKIGSVALGAATGGLSALGGMAMRGLQNIGVKGQQDTYDQAQNRQNMRSMGINPSMATKSAQNIHEGISHLSIRKEIQKQEEWEKQRDAGEDYVEGWDNPADYDRDQGDQMGLTPKEALQICEAGGCVWLKDYADENYGDDDDPHYHYPVEDPEDILTMMEDGMFEGDNPVVIMSDPTGTSEEMLGSRGYESDEANAIRAMRAMRSARIGNDSASFEDLMDDRQDAIDQGKDLQEHYRTGAVPREDDDLGKGLQMLNIRNSIQKGE